MHDEKHHNLMIISLILGIILIVVSYIIFPSSPEYFTELYFTNSSDLPKYIEPHHSQSYAFTIYNHERKIKIYNAKVTAKFVSVDNITKEYTTGRIITVPKETAQDININFTLPNFFKADITTTLEGLDQNIYFFVYNKDMVLEYPDTLALTWCFPENHIKASDSFTIRARGSFQPGMKVRIDGKEIYSTIVTNTQYKNFKFNYPISNNVIDIIFDNDYYDVKTGKDRNLYIESITIGDQKFDPTDGIFDGGSGIYAFDCQSITTTESTLAWNGALRFKFIQ